MNGFFHDSTLLFRALLCSLMKNQHGICQDISFHPPPVERMIPGHPPVHTALKTGGALFSWEVEEENVAVNPVINPGKIYMVDSPCRGSPYTHEGKGGNWSGRPDSNRRPSAPKADALPGCATSRRKNVGMKYNPAATRGAARRFSSPRSAHEGRSPGG